MSTKYCYSPNALYLHLKYHCSAAVFVEVAKRRTLRDIKLAADAMPYNKPDTAMMADGALGEPTDFARYFAHI
jgi:hypothetical protein